MIKHIYTLKSEYKGKDIYIWGIGKRAEWTFSFLAYRGIAASGFVTCRERFFSESFLGCPVISPEEFSLKDDALMLMEYSVDRETFRRISGYGKCLYFKEAFEIDPALTECPCYIYGTKIGAWNMLSRFASNGIECGGFLLSEKTGPDQIAGIPVYQYDRTGFSGRDRIVVSAVSEDVVNDILEHIQSRDFPGDVYIDELVQYTSIWSTDPFLMLDDAVKSGKRILLCCEDALGRELIGKICGLYDIRIDREVCFSGDEEKGLGDIWALSDEDPEGSVVLIFAFNKKRRYEIVCALNDMGYSPEKHNFAGVQRCLYSGLLPLKRIGYEKDTRLGTSLDYTALGGIPGWAVYGDGKDGLRIMVLGGSTSSDVYYPENWVSKLYKRFISDGSAATIYNGAHEGNTSSHELLRLTRDIDFIKPDIVISLSGLNDLDFRRDLDKFEALNGESAFVFWKRMESYMKMISEAAGARFISILQPINEYMGPSSLSESLMFSADPDDSSQRVSPEKRKDDLCIDLMDLFHHREGMFIDKCHYSDEANGIIADIVYRLIKEGC